MDFSQIQFIYRAEGNANLVLYLPEYKKVLRLPKTTISSSSTGLLGKNKNPLDLKDHLVYMEFMIYLLGNEYTCRPEIISLSFTDSERINHYCRPFRPVKRLDKMFCGQFGILLPDATFLPENIEVSLEGDTFAVEIKPKQGWLLQDILTKCDLFDLKNSTKCRYCAMQYYKLKSGKILNVSTYCPLDLFSGEINRMKKAIDALFQFPQNNLRVFKNGNLCYTDDNSTVENCQKDFFNVSFDIVQQVIVKSLLKKFDNENSEIESLPAVNELPDGCVLQKILSLQLLTKKNIELMTIKKNSNEKTYNCIQLIKLKGKPNNINELTPLEQYLIGCTAMDCSIMLAFKEIKDENFIRNFKTHKHHLEINEKHFGVKITIVDTDLKPDNHFQKLVKQTNEAYQHEFNFRNNLFNI